MVGEDDIREIEVERRILGGRIRIVKGGGEPQAVAHVQPASAAQTTFVRQAEEVSGPETAATTPDEADGFHSVCSPMVGLFYRGPSPDVPPYVEAGDVVSAGQTLCIIEAMKIMNEIEADVEGRVVRILVENGRPVEYNTPLFFMEPL